MKVTVKKADAAESATEKKLSEQEIMESFVDPAIVGLGFALSKIPNQQMADKIVGLVVDKLNTLEYKEGEEPTWKDCLNALLKIAQASAKLTPTKVDDVAVDIAELANGYVQGTAKFADVFEVMIKTKQLNKLKKQEAKVSAQTKK